MRRDNKMTWQEVAALVILLAALAFAVLAGVVALFWAIRGQAL